MRVATFNVYSGRVPGEPTVDPARITAAVTALDADVLALQEVDRDQPRSGHVDVTALAVRAMGAVEHRFVAAVHGTPGLSWTPAEGESVDVSPGAGPQYGVALLSRYPVDEWRILRLAGSRVAIPLPVPGRRWPLLVHDEPRVALIATVRCPGGPVTVVCTHLSFVPWAARRQLRSVTEAVGSAPGPTVILGDLNLGPRTVELLTAMTTACDLPTHPAHRPRRQLDHVLLGAGLRLTGSAVRRLAVSDHLAVVADLERS